MRTGIRRIVIGGVAAATLVTGMGAAMAASNGTAAPKAPAVTKVKTTDATEVRREPEARGRAAEGEAQAGDVRGREAEPGDDRGVHEQEPGDDRGMNAGPSANAGPGSTNDRRGHDAMDDHGRHGEPEPG